MPFTSRKRPLPHRALLNAVVTCKVMGKVFSGRSVNIDHEGMLVETTDEVRVGDFISLTLQIPSGDIAEVTKRRLTPTASTQREGVILQPRGRIVRVQKENPAEGLGRAIDVRFLDLTDEEAGWIRAYVGTTGVERHFQPREGPPPMPPARKTEEGPAAAGAAPSVPPPETGPSRPVRYRLLSLLGRGGMGKVYKAMDNELGEIVAIKVLSGDLAEDGHWVRRFKDEVKMMRRIRHTNVVQVYEFGQVKEGKFFAMEYVDGIPLSSILRDEGPLPLSRILPLARQIASGLQAIHDQGIVHRDLKPQNILVEPGGRVALVDFGIARSLRLDQRQTDTGRMMGTPFYMSPEQIRGQEADGRSDLYSLGVILFEMSTGELPFRGESAVTNAYRTLYENPPAPSIRNQRLPRAFDGLVTKLLAKRPDERFQAAGAVEAEIQGLEGRLAQGGLTAARTAPLKVLLVEPDEANRQAVQRALNSRPARITEAMDGYEAMARVFEERFDLAILAIGMPRIPGFEACQILQSSGRSRRTRILLTTGSRKDIEYAGFLGVQCHVWGSGERALTETIEKLLQGDLQG